MEPPPPPPQPHLSVPGVIEVGTQLMLGPTPEGGFLPVAVTCIQRAQISVSRVQGGQAATLALQVAGEGGRKPCLHCR